MNDNEAKTLQLGIITLGLFLVVLSLCIRSTELAEIESQTISKETEQ